MTYSELKPGMELRLFGLIVKITSVEEPAASEGLIVVFDILSDDLFRKKTGWSFFHLYPCQYDDEIEVEAYNEIEEYE